ncbi:hypothetical protein P4V54_01855 [Brevibacillus nitrificans]|uniref:hypothetical protein n=1 Tax=Brevibacillus nitrificans TaxID=651560 RepID=UPI002E24138B|nr:hypothetical protein [Brevibacillus nitrificans]
MISKIIDFAYGAMPPGFSTGLSECLYQVDVDIYMTPDFSGGTLYMLTSEENYILVKATGKEHVTYRQLGTYELLEGIYSKGDYLHSFYLANNVFKNKQNQTVRLIALFYEHRGRIHVWNPTFEELFLPLILDDLETGTDAHLRSIREIHRNRSKNSDVYAIAVRNQVDYEIGDVVDGLGVSTVVLYSLLNHIFLVEDEKFPHIPGADRTLKAYEELHDEYERDCVDMTKWRQRNHLKNPWV